MKTALPQAASLSVVRATNSSTVNSSATNPDPTNPTNAQPASHIGILRAVLGNLQDGFIIASQLGEIHQINLPAERICNLLSGASGSEDSRLPAEIWHVCQSALKNKDVLSSHKSGIDADIILPKIGLVRVRVQNMSIGEDSSFLIVLEDRQQTIRNRALSDAAIYGLTERETEIWQMRLKGSAYKEISTALWISVDTVKKHVKNILAKQRSHQDDLEYALMA
ncbi:MAG: helix-turn-helix transcriptional regulator [Cyanobacteria bacterium J06576_12]